MTVTTHKFYKAIALQILLSLGIVWSAMANGPTCDVVFEDPKNDKPAAASTSKADPSQGPQPEIWQSANEMLSARLKGQTHPFTTTALDADAIGRVHKLFRAKLPIYDKTVQKTNLPTIEHKEYLELKKQAIAEVQKILRDPKADVNSIFAAYEVVRHMSIIEAVTNFPREITEQRDAEKQKEHEEQNQQEQDQQQKQQQNQQQQDQQQNQQQNQQQQKGQQQQQKKKDQKQDFKWDRKKDRYKPDNKDMNFGAGGDGGVEILWTTSNVPKRLLRETYFDVITDRELVVNPLLRPKASASKANADQNQVTHLLVAGAKEIEIPIQYGMEPILGKYEKGAWEVIETQPGEYVVKIHDSNREKVSIFLRPVREVRFGTSGEDQYSKPTGIDAKAWPTEMLAFVSQLKKESTDRLDIAKKLEQFFQTDGGYTYYAEGDQLNATQLKSIDKKLAELEKKFPKPVALARLGTFQCDGAAWIGAALLKDFFKIPVRVVGGRTIAPNPKEINSTRFHYARSSDPKHAWVEVFDGRQWVPFDMTPKNNQPKGHGSQESEAKKQDNKNQQESDESQGQDSSKSDKESKSQSKSQEKSEAGEKSEKSEQQGQESSESDSSESQGQSQSKGQDKKDGQQKSKKGDKENESSEASEGKGSKDKEGDKKGEQKADEQKDAASEKAERDLEEFLKMKAGGEKESKLQSNPLFFETFKVLRTWGLERLVAEPKRETVSGDYFNLLSTFTNLNLQSFNLHAQEWFSDKVRRSRKAKDEALNQWVSSVRLMASKGDLREAFLELQTMKFMVQSLAEVRRLTEQESNLLENIERSLLAFLRVRHKDSEAYDMVDNLVRNLPGGISKKILRETYGEDYMTLGSLALDKLAADLKSGRLAPLKRMALLDGFAEMVLNSEKIPNYKDQKQFMRSPVPNRTSDIVVARSAMEFQKFLWQPEAGQGLFTKLFEGKQFAIGNRETSKVIDPKQPIERKVSVVFFDISGSMGGDKILVQDTLLMNFVDKALSETDVFGKPVHEVFIIPFDDRVYEGVHVKSQDQALRFIREKISTPSQSQGGTDIQKAIVKFYDIVGAAYRENVEKSVKNFKKANLILFSDGGSHVDEATILRARGQVPKDVTINFNFVGIAESNPTLEQLANNSNLSTTKPMVHMLSNEVIAEVINQSRKTVGNKDAFATDIKSAQLPADITQSLNRLANEVPDVRMKGDVIKVKDMLAKLGTAKHDIESISNPLAISQLSILVNQLKKVQLSDELKLKILQRVLEVYPDYAGRRLNNLTYTEYDLILELKSWSNM